MNNKALFNVALALHEGQPLPDEERLYLEQLFPEKSHLFLIAGERFLYPSPPPAIAGDLIWDALGFDITGIFCRRLHGYERIDIGGHMLCAAYLGKNDCGLDIAAGVIYSHPWNHAGNFIDEFYNLVGRIKRFYSEFARSSVIATFLNDNEQFGYIIDPVSRQVAFTRCPDSAWIPPSQISDDRRRVETLVPRLLSALPDISLVDGHNEFTGNMTIKRFSLAGDDFILLSFPATRPPEIRDFDPASDPLMHRLRNKLSALQTASSQLLLQKGNIINDDELALCRVIRKASEDIEQSVCALESREKSRSDFLGEARAHAQAVPTITAERRVLSGTRSRSTDLSGRRNIKEILVGHE